MEFAVRVVADTAQHLIRIRHLRDRLRRHKGTDLDGVKPGPDQRLDKGDAVGDADRRLFVLQAVARPDLDDVNPIAHVDLIRQPARLRRVRRLPARYRRACI
jgi:hypothetical protein